MLFDKWNKYQEISDKLDAIHTDLSQINQTFTAEKKQPNYSRIISVISGTAGLIGLLGNGINYLIEFQYCRYWSIPTRFIQASGSGAASRFFILFVMVLMLLIPGYWILDNLYDAFQLIWAGTLLKGKRKVREVIRIIFFTLLLDIIYAVSMALLIAVYGGTDYKKGLIFSSCFTIAIILFTMFNSYRLYKAKPQKKMAMSNNKALRDTSSDYEQYCQWIKFTFVYLIVVSFAIFVFDLFITRVQTEFDIVDRCDNTYVVLYLSGDNKIMKECIDSGDNLTINLNKTFISSEPVEYETKNYIGTITRSYYGIKQNKYDSNSVNDMM